MINIIITCLFTSSMSFVLYVDSIAISSKGVGYNSAEFFGSLFLGHSLLTGTFFSSNVRSSNK